MAKENDWFAANLGNPDFSPEDFKSIGGLSIDNTQFLSKEEYKNKPKVKEIFTDENGKFDENKFNNFYDAQVQKWNEFIDESAIDTYERSIWDVDIVKEPKSKIKDPHFEFTRVPNPDRVSIGVAGRNVYEESATRCDCHQIHCSTHWETGMEEECSNYSFLKYRKL